MYKINLQDFEEGLGVQGLSSSTYSAFLGFSIKILQPVLNIFSHPCVDESQLSDEIVPKDM